MYDKVFEHIMAHPKIRLSDVAPFFAERIDEREAAMPRQGRSFEDAAAADTQEGTLR
ncbi:MAG: hypothetical protein ABW215_01735 [Kibdelosporangium sp.]